MNETYKLLQDHNIIKEGHFVLTSGRHSRKYINKDDIICSSPHLYKEVIYNLQDLVQDYIGRKQYDIVTGPAVAGIAFAAPVAQSLDKPFVYSEKTPEGGVSFRKTFQDKIKDKNVIIIEDIITTAGSVKKTMQAIQECGGKVVAVFCIWNRNPEIKGLTSLGGEITPLYGLIEEEIESWEPGSAHCPYCGSGVPLVNIKTGKTLDRV